MYTERNAQGMHTARSCAHGIYWLGSDLGRRAAGLEGKGTRACVTTITYNTLMFLHLLAPQNHPWAGEGVVSLQGSSVLLSLWFAMSRIKSSLIKEEVRP